MQAVLNERVLALLTLLIAGIALLLTTFGTEFATLGAAQSPVFFPRIILGLWIGLTLVALMQDIAARKAVDPVDKIGALLLFVVAAVIYANCVTRLGFMLSSVPFAVISLLVFGVRNPLVIAAYAVAVPGAIVVLFNHILKLPLPVSPFTHLF